MKNIFVGNLNVAATESDLRSLFVKHGKVDSVTLVRDRDTGHTRGFAFIEMPNDEEAEAAIQALNGTLLGELQLSVNEARPKLMGLDGKTPEERRKQARDPLPTRTHRQHRY